MSALNSISYLQPQIGNETITISAGEILASTNVTSCDEPKLEAPQNNQVICQGGVCSLGAWKPGTKKFND